MVDGDVIRQNHKLRLYGFNKQLGCLVTLTKYKIVAFIAKNNSVNVIIASSNEGIPPFI